MTDDSANPPALSLRARRRFVAARGAGHCEYCRMVERFQGAPYHVEHVIPSSRLGSDGLDNLAWACPSCNLTKSARLTLTDPVTATPTEVFNPRTMRWDSHFEWSGYRIVGRTSVGRAIINALDLNSALRVGIRQMEQREGCFPPPDGE